MADRNWDEKKRELLAQQPVNLVPLSTFTKEGSARGLYLPSGIHLMEMNKVSDATLVVYATQLNASMFTVKGVWSFEPNAETVTIDKFPQGVEAFRKGNTGTG